MAKSSLARKWTESTPERARLRAVRPARWSPLARVLIALVGIGTLTHLLGLAHPAQVVFDEVHMGKFVSAYVGSHQRIFDIHPPHGKLLIAAAAKLGGYDGKFTFEKIGQPYSPNVPLVALRIVPAIAGILIPPLFALFLAYLGATLPTVLLGGLALALENALLVETRLLLFDGILIAATLASLVLLLKANHEKGMKFYRTSAFCGLAAGLAVGTKFTGLAVLGLIGVFLVVKILKHRSRAYTKLRLRQGAVIYASAALVFLAGWAIHFSLLTNPGPADAFHPTTGNFWTDLVKVNQTMLAANANLTKRHPDGSPAWTWPIMKVAPFYWVGDGATIYLLGNPVIWWGGTLLFFGIVMILLMTRFTHLKIDPPARHTVTLWLPLTGYVASYLPLIGVTRVLFLYHYLTPLIFSLATVLLWLDQAGWIRSTDPRRQRRSYYVVVGLLVLGFLAVAPLSYGISGLGLNSYLTGLVRSWR